MRRYPALPRGTMRPVKKILGIGLIVAGAGLTFFPDKIVPFLCNNKIIFGIGLMISGYFFVIAGRRFPNGIWRQ